MAIIRRKLDQNSISQEIDRISKKYNDRSPIVLADKYSDVPPAIPFVDCGKESVDLLKKFDVQKNIFIYACEQDDIGLPFVEFIIDNKGIFEPIFCSIPSSYANINNLARSTLESEYVYQTTNNFAKWDYGYGDFANLTQALELTRNIAGAFVEIGCYRGSSSCVALRYLCEANIRRDCYFFDVFTGFDYDEAKTSADKLWLGTHQTEGIDVVKSRLNRFCSPPNGLSVVVQKSNIITDDLPPEINKIAVANIDVDMYEAVLSALIKVSPLINQSGIIIVEDPGHTPALIGARAALTRFLRDNGYFIPIYLESGQTFLIRM